MKALILLPFLLTYYIGVEGLRCYTCSMTNEDVDQNCLTDPDKAGITDCDKQYCISVRVDYVDPKDSLQSLSRTCVDTPLYTNKVLEDETFRSYYKACQTELCNGGLGKDLTDTSSNINGAAMTLLVPGTGAAHSAIISVSLIFLLQVVLTLNNM
ncbi:hypothetical protein Trydic_g16966 [Trypoxylus dichotomus]